MGAPSSAWIVFDPETPVSFSPFDPGPKDLGGGGGVVGKSRLLLRKLLPGVDMNDRLGLRVGVAGSGASRAVEGPGRRKGSSPSRFAMCVSYSASYSPMVTKISSRSCEMSRRLDGNRSAADLGAPSGAAAYRWTHDGQPSTGCSTPDACELSVSEIHAAI